MHATPDPDALDDVTQSIVHRPWTGPDSPCARGRSWSATSLWRGDFDTWLARLDQLASPIPWKRGSWQSGLILDFQAVFGSREAAVQLRDRLWEYVRTKAPSPCPCSSTKLTDYRLPLTFYGAFITERDGAVAGVPEHQEQRARPFDQQLPASWHSSTTSCRTTTCDRIRALARGRAYFGKTRRSVACGLGIPPAQAAGDRPGLRRRGNPRRTTTSKPTALDKEERAELKAAIQTVEKLVRLVQAGTGL